MGLSAAIAAAGVAVSAGSAIAGSMGSDAAQQAGQIQGDAANHAADVTMAMFNQTQANLAPFLAAGRTALGPLTAMTGTGPGGNPLTAPLTARFNPTIENLRNTPGYQFTLNQGLQAAQNGFAAQGLGSSGAAIKGATNYAEGLAGTTFQQQFDNYLKQNQQVYNMLGGIAGSGQNAAAGLGALGLQSAGVAGGFDTSGAAARAAGIVGGTNALSGGIGGALSGVGNTGLLSALNNAGMFGSKTQTPEQQTANDGINYNSSFYQNDREGIH